MFRPSTPKDGLAGLLQEIRGETAGAMGRISRKLEERLEACARLRDELAALPGDDAAARAALVAEYERQRKDAKLHYWYLVVQREAIGMYAHATLERLYPIPPRLG